MEGFPRECGEDSVQIRMQTVRREEYIKANRLERTASSMPYRRPAAAVAAFHFQHSSQYAKCPIFILLEAASARLPSKTNNHTNFLIVFFFFVNFLPIVVDLKFKKRLSHPCLAKCEKPSVQFTLM